MRYMLISMADANAFDGNPPDPRLMAAIGQLGEEMSRAGVLVDMGGMEPGTAGARYLATAATSGPRMRLVGGRVSMTDGPFAESKEIIGGFALVQVESEAEAIAISRRFLELHAEVLGPSYEAHAEVRRLPDPA